MVILNSNTVGFKNQSQRKVSLRISSFVIFNLEGNSIIKPETEFCYSIRKLIWPENENMKDF